MWADSFSCVRKEASTAESRSLCSGAMVCVTITGMRTLFVVLGVQLLIALVFVALVATDNLPFTGDGDGEAAPPAPAASAKAANRFDGPTAFALLKMQLSYGPRPARPEAGRLEAVARARRAAAQAAPARPLPEGAARAAEHRGHRARQGPEALRRRRRPLRQQGPVRLPRRERRRRRDGRRGRARAPAQAAHDRPHRQVRPLRRRGEPARRAR